MGAEPCWRRVVTACWAVVRGLVISGAVVVGALFGLNRLAGDAAFVVVSGSMAPAMRSGDVVLDAKVPFGRIRPGDVVSLREPAAPFHLITHRVVAVEQVGTQNVIVTRGDANGFAEAWPVDRTTVIRTVVHHLSGAATWPFRFGRWIALAGALCCVELTGAFRVPGRLRRLAGRRSVAIAAG